MEENTKNPITNDVMHDFNMADNIMGDIPLIGQAPHKAKAKKEPDYTHFPIICSKEIKKKVKMLAAKEHFTIRAVIEKMLGDGLAAYEKKHGPLEATEHNIDDLY